MRELIVFICGVVTGVVLTVFSSEDIFNEIENWKEE